MQVAARSDASGGPSAATSTSGRSDPVGGRQAAATPAVAYVVNQYPSVSHTFIRREIVALEEAGVPVTRFALRGWEAVVADPADVAEKEKTRYALRSGAVGLLVATLATMLATPGRFWRALRTTLSLSRGRDRPLLLYLIYLAEAAQLARWLRPTRVQHLHAHFGTNSATVAILAGELAGIGCSFTVHGPDEFDRPAAISLAKKIEAARFVVAISSFGRGQMYRWVHRDQWDKVKVVRCGVDRSFRDGLPPADGGFPSGHFVCVGRICEQKGQLLLVEALAGLKQRGVDARLVLAGDGPMRRDIEERAAELGVADRIRITGWISGERVRQEILDARFLVLPSFAEGIPVVFMEAMALKRPVISTYVAGIPELVQPGRTGWLVPSGDVHALTDIMGQCLEVPEATWREVGQAARERVLRHHDVDVEAARLRELFARAIEQGGTGR